LYPNKKPQITFDAAKNKVSGSTSCNKFNSSFTVNASSINIADPVTMTKMACAGDGENAFLNMMKKINKFSLSGNTLNLLIDDVAVMRFEKKTYALFIKRFYFIWNNRIIKTPYNTKIKN